MIHICLHNFRLRWRSWERARYPSRSDGTYLMEGEYFLMKSPHFLFVKKFTIFSLLITNYVLKQLWRLGSRWAHCGGLLETPGWWRLKILEKPSDAAGLSCSYKSLLPLLSWCCSEWTKTEWCYVTLNVFDCLELWNRNASMVSGCIMPVCFSFRHAVAAFMWKDHL